MRDRREVRRTLSSDDRAPEREVDEEVAFHLERRAEVLRQRGYGDADARRIALAEFGDVHSSRRELVAIDTRRRRRRRLAHTVESIWQDVRHAVRSLARSPGFSISAFATLVVGIAATTAMFTVVDGILVRPLPFKDPERLVGVWNNMAPVNLPHAPQSVTTYFTYRTQARAIDAIGIYKEAAANVVVPGQGTDPERLPIGRVSATLFTVLGVPALRGRFFSDEEDRPGAAPVAVVSEGVWRSRFGGDASAIGRRIDVNGTVREIVGVMPESFRVPSAQTALWIPLNVDPANPPGDAFTYNAIARLKPGVTLDAAQRDFGAVLSRVVDLYPKFVAGITTRQIMDQTNPVPVVTSLRDDTVGGIARTLLLIAGAATLLFLVASVNVGNLTLVRFDARRRELAVRQSLGAAGSRVARGYVAELAVVAAAAVVVGIAIAYFAVQLLVHRGPAEIPRVAEVALDARGVLFAVAMGVIATAIGGVIPVLRILRGNVTLAKPVRGGTASREEHRTRRMLAAAQVAIALAVLSASGLLFRSFRTLNAVRPGFDSEHVATLWVSLPSSRYPTDASVVRFYSNLLARVKTLPGIATAGLTSRVPLIARGFNDNPLYPEDAAAFDTKLPPLQLFTTVGGDYFRAMGIPLLAGKMFDEFGVQREGDAVISRRTAELFWHDATGQASVGKRFRILPTSRWYTVVGVAADAHDSSLATRPSPTVYFPETESTEGGQHASRTMAIAIRSGGDPLSVTASVQRAVHELDPLLPAFDIQPMAGAVRASTARLGFTLILVGGSALVTLFLGVIGLYGVMSYIVSLRRRELGIRLALGATPVALAAATTREAVTIVAFGVAAGLVLFAISAMSMRAVLFGVASSDPLTLVSASGVMAALSLVACWIPARRAANIDPAETMRAE